MNILFLLIGLLIAGLYLYASARFKRRLAARFENRTEISIDELYDRHYRSTGIRKELVDELICHLARELTIPERKLRPSDRFDKELSPEAGWEWGSGHSVLSSEVKSLCRKAGRDGLAGSIQTLDDYIRVMAEIYPK